jgi:pyruvate carboxylase subunit B
MTEHEAMTYHVTLGGRTYVVVVGDGEVTVDGTAWASERTAIPESPLHHLRLGGRSWAVAAHPATDGAGPGATQWMLHAGGERWEAEVVDERTLEVEALARREVAPAGGAQVVAPMPGMVVRVEVEVGQRVDAGAGLVVVEAMKMENEIRASRPGVVAEVHVGVGQPVEKGAPLVTIDAPEASG